MYYTELDHNCPKSIILTKDYKSRRDFLDAIKNNKKLIKQKFPNHKFIVNFVIETTNKHEREISGMEFIVLEQIIETKKIYAADYRGKRSEFNSVIKNEKSEMSRRHRKRCCVLETRFDDFYGPGIMIIAAHVREI